MFYKTLLALSVAVATVSAATDRVVCYWGTWSHYRLGNGKFTVDQIDANLCTHIIYGFVGLNSDGTVNLLDTWLDIDLQNFQKVNALKQQNPNLKTLIAIGGWNEGSEKYSNVAASASLRATLIQSALSLVQTYGFDGFDLDWEYPNQRGGVAADIQNYVSLLKEFRAEFDKYGLILTAAVAAAAGSVDLSYDVPALSQYLDFINVMTYDLHGSWDDVTGQNAPLYASSLDTTENQKLLNVDAAIQGWIARGADPQKIILGVGLYGRTFTLSNSANTGLGAAAAGGGSQGKYTGEMGFVGYHEIVELRKEGGWTVVWDDEQKVPYTYKGNQWIGFDNPKSVALKVDYAKNLNLGGIMVWSIDTDDFNGLSGTNNALLSTINQALQGTWVEGEEEEEVVVTEAPAAGGGEEETESPGEESESETTGLCSAAGYIRDPDDCSVYHYCQANSDGSFTVLTSQCSNGLYYDLALHACNWPDQVDC